MFVFQKPFHFCISETLSLMYFRNLFTCVFYKTFDLCISETFHLCFKHLDPKYLKKCLARMSYTRGIVVEYQYQGAGIGIVLFVVKNLLYPIPNQRPKWCLLGFIFKLEINDNKLGLSCAKLRWSLASQPAYLPLHLKFSSLFSLFASTLTNFQLSSN